MKYLFIILFLFSFSFAEKHIVLYKGLEIGNIENVNKQLETSNYLLGTVYDGFLKYLIMSDYFCLYQNEEPKLENTFFKKNEKIISLLKMFKTNPVGDHAFEDKRLVSSCIDNVCSYNYYSKGLLKSYGVVLLNGRDIDVVFDEKNDVLISNVTFLKSK